MAATPASYSSHLFAMKEPTLYPSMLAGGVLNKLDRFPFNNPATEYHYLGRTSSHALCQAMGLEGKEMLFPAFFGNPVLQAPLTAGVEIKFYPVRRGLRVDPNDIEAAITEKTRAIYLIHYAGFPGPIDEVLEIARKRDLIVIEDCAHGLLTTHRGQPLGTFGDGAFFSFYKWVPVPNGAAAVINRRGVSPLMHGKPTPHTSSIALGSFSLLNNVALRGGAAGRAIRSGVRAAGRTAAHASNLSYIGTGSVKLTPEELEFAMSGLAHRIMHAQHLDKVAERRRRNFNLLSELLADIAPAIQGPLPTGATPLFYATEVNDKRSVLARLAARGVEGRNFWEIFNPLMPKGIFEETDELRRTTLELPIHQDLSVATIHRIAQAMKEVMAGQSSTSYQSTAAAD